MAEQTSNPSSSTRRSAEVRRKSIIAAARTLFARHGFHGTSMAEIARMSEVMVGQIYRDFADKEDLIAAIVERDTSALLDGPELARAIEGGKAGALTEWVEHFIARELGADARSVLADILSEATRNPRMASILSQAQERLRKRLASAATVWAPGAEKEAERQELSDLILAASGAVIHGEISGLRVNDRAVARLIGLVRAEVDRLSQNA